jgi:peptide/nickel transport system permease protein
MTTTDHLQTTEPAGKAEDRLYSASPWQLTWWRFRKHRLGMVGAAMLVFFYLIAAVPGFFATSHPDVSAAQRALIPPQGIHFWDEGRFDPFVYGLKGKRDLKTMKRIYVADPAVKHRVRLFVRGFEYSLFGLVKTDIHLFGTVGADAKDTLALLGTDIQGRDMWSLLMYATQTSLLIGLLGVTISLFLGILLGGISGLYGGLIDTIIQRVIEILRSIPTIPLWLGLGAAVPGHWGVTETYFAITLIISLIGWTSLARVVRGKFLSLRREDFVLAARLYGCSEMRIIFRHMVPSFLSHIIAATTLALPAMIVSETALSFLGLGLRPPAMSWGVLLQQAQNLQAIALTPWLMMPAVFVTLAILAFNFVGDGLRDAADPYAR